MHVSDGSHYDARYPEMVIVSLTVVAVAVFGKDDVEQPPASNPFRQFGAFPHASKNSCIGARRTLACARDPKLQFTLNLNSRTKYRTK
jgi:hypothetical protein